MNRRPYAPRDLDSIEELNYISTIKEDAIIDAHIEELREMGYGSIVQPNDLHQLFWDFTRKGIVLDKLYRVAVVECIDEESLYTRFLGMARRYNGWSDRHRKDFDERLRRELDRRLKQKDSVIEDVRQKLRESQQNVGELKNRIHDLEQKSRPRTEGAQIAALRHELRKEYNIQLQEQRHKAKPEKTVGKTFLRRLCVPGSRLFEAYDLTREEDALEYVEWFRMGDKRVNTATQRNIALRYEGQDLTVFNGIVTRYNAEWDAAHQGQNVEEDNE